MEQLAAEPNAFVGPDAEVPANPLAKFGDDQLIAAFRHTRDVTLKALAEEFKAKTEPLTARMKLIQNEMQRRLLERGANHSSTESGTAYLADAVSVECTDKMAFLTFCVENFADWGKDLLTANAAKETVELYIEKSKSEEHPHGYSPPGISVTYAKRLNIRK